MIAAYPRTYRSVKAYRMVCRVLALFFVALLIYAFVGAAAGWIRRARGPFDEVFFLSVTLILAGHLWAQAGQSVTIYPDSIEVRGRWGRTKTLRKLEIRGRSFMPGGWRSQSYHVLFPVDSRPVRLAPNIDEDHLLRSWLHDIPLVHS